MAMTHQQKRARIKRRIRKKVRGTASRPRLLVYRGLRNISAQLADDDAHRTLCSVTSLKIAPATILVEGDSPQYAISREVGRQIAAKAKEQNITAVVFDRSGYQYHGRVKALAEGAREGGLKF